VRLDGGLGYDVAVAFNDLLQHLPERPDAAARRAARAEADSKAETPDSILPDPSTVVEAAPAAEAAIELAAVAPEDILPELGELPQLPDVAPEAMLQLTAEVDATEQLRDLLESNGW
jgi:hypothetical protein